MKRTLALAVLMLGLMIPVAAPSTAAPPPTATTTAAVPAGDGTSNFHFSRSCGINFPLGAWASISWTNYDSGRNQIVHTNIRRSGPGIRVEVWINGVFIESGDLEDYYTWPGHSKVSVMLRASNFPGSWSNCTRTAP